MTNGNARSCSVPGCGRKHYARGMCQGHDKRVRLHGDAMADKPLAVYLPRAGRDLRCTITGCAKPLTTKDARGMCAMHYRRWRLYGDAATVFVQRGNGSASERFWARVDTSGDCWLWTGKVTWQGYGRCSHAGQTLAHRFAYIDTVGPIPENLEIDHMCHTIACNDGVECVHRRCVRPDHLLAVPHIDNVARTVRGVPRVRKGAA